MKQAILMRQDLKLPKGKLAAQAAHAAVEAALRSPERLIRAWRQEGMAKVVLKVKDERELLQHLQQAKDAGIITALITDAGRTVVEPGTKTCGALGPADDAEIDRLVGSLKLV